MKPHTKIVCDFFGIATPEEGVCEYCLHLGHDPAPCVDVHHMDARKMGGDKSKDRIDNLAMLCRTHHELLEKDYALNERFQVWVSDLVLRKWVFRDYLFREL